MPDKSTDIESDNIIKRYQRRPRKLEELCLANFVAWFNCVKDKDSHENNNCNTSETSDSFLLETEVDNVDDDPSVEYKQTEYTTGYKLKGGMKLIKRKRAKIIRSVRFNKEKDPENYYREQLMLYTPWRNEQKDLIKECQTYQERYQQVESIVNSNKEQYEYHSDILEKAIQDLTETDNTCDDPVAPNTQHINEQDGAVKTKHSKFFGCFDPGTNKQHSQYDLFDDMGILPRHNDQEELVQNRLHDSDYRELVRSLNIKQKEFFYHVLHSVKTKNEQVTLFLSGGAGVGKSTVTNALYEALTRYLNSIPGENPDEVKVVKVAPTGKAAFNINGNTLHSAFKIPANRGFQYCTLDADRLNTIRTQLRKLKVIFIDEVSMVGSGMFNFLNLRLQQIMASNKPFGGVSVIAVGDLFQLKPVFDNWIFDNTNHGFGDLATNIWNEYFTLFELTEIMRQRDDKKFAELLNRLREGNHTQNDIDMLKERILRIKLGNKNYPINTTHLFSTNALVNYHNNSLYQASHTEKAEIKCIDIIVGDMSDDLKKKMKEKIPDDASKTMGLYNVVLIAVGAKYDLTANVDVADGMTNGAECIIEKIDYRVINSNRPSIIWVSFPQSNIGKNHSKEYGHLFTNNEDNTWTPILEITRQFKISKRHQCQVLRRQYPLRQATPKTIHRCQGDTLDEAVLDLPSSSREHMHYVALSRVRNISTLYIHSLNEKKICISEKVKKEMSRLREKPLAPCIPCLYNNDKPSRIKVLFHNVRSLRLHFDDIKCDYNVQAADINIFVETRLCYSDNNAIYEINNFKLFRNDFCMESNVRTAYGTAFYIKNSIKCISEPYRCNFNDVEITVCVIHEPIPNLHIIGIYRSKAKVSLQNFVTAINHTLDAITCYQNRPTIILGDFNIDLMDQCSSQCKTLINCLINQRGYTQVLNQYTTDYCTQIDHIYTNVPNDVQSVGVLQSYYSDHKPVYVCLT